MLSAVLLIAHIVVRRAFVAPLLGVAWHAGPRDGGHSLLVKSPGHAQRASENAVAPAVTPWTGGNWALEVRMCSCSKPTASICRYLK
jgi:hypothetical protein